jgi:hypothetical protein
MDINKASSGFFNRNSFTAGASMFGVPLYSLALLSVAAGIIVEWLSKRLT